MRKINISKLVDIPKLFKRLWICLWVIEVIMLVGKLCFNLWYPIVSNVEWFTSLCNFIDSNMVISLFIHLILYVLSNNLWYLTNTKRMKYNTWWEFIGINLIMLICFFVKTASNVLGLLIELCILIGCPIFYNIIHKTFKKPICILLPIITYLLLNVWQMNMFLIRNVGEILTTAPTLITLLLQIDFYIFTIITWTGVNYYGKRWTRMVVEHTNN